MMEMREFLVRADVLLSNLGPEKLAELTGMQNRHIAVYKITEDPEAADGPVLLRSWYSGVHDVGDHTLYAVWLADSAGTVERIYADSPLSMVNRLFLDETTELHADATDPGGPHLRTGNRHHEFVSGL